MLVFNDLVYEELKNSIFNLTNGQKVFGYKFVKTLVLKHDTEISDSLRIKLYGRIEINHHLTNQLEMYLIKFVQENEYVKFQNITHYNYNYRKDGFVNKLKKNKSKWGNTVPIIIIDNNVYLKKDVAVLMKLFT
jgi:hypothetical protein